MSESREEPEVVDGEIVDARRVPAPVQPSTGRSLVQAAPVVVQAAAVAATGFVAGAATLTLAKHVRARRAAKVNPRRQVVKAAGPSVVASRSFLIDVHLLGSRE